MIIYNVTVNIDEDALDEWVIWMKDVHIPEVMNTGMFLDFSFSKLITRQEDETGSTYVIQYLCSDMLTYERYQAEFAPALQQKTLSKFGNKVVAFRTLMERV